MYKTIFFDLDDTLWDFSSSAKISLALLYHQFHLDSVYDSFDTFYNRYKKRNSELWEEYAKGMVTKEFLSLERFAYPLRTVGLEDIELIGKMSIQFLDNTNHHTKLIDGAIEILDYLKPKYQLAAVTNGFVEAQYVKLQKTGLSPYFSKVILSEEVGCMKPDIQFFNIALHSTQTEAKEALVVGDNYQFDILGAKAAGLEAIYYNRGMAECSLDENNTKTIYNLSQIADFL